MKFIIPLIIIPFTLATPAQAEMITVNVNRVCAAIVNIPYASDNFTDKEWEQFKNCRNFLRRYDNIE
jgi:hypothetical protein